MKRKLFLAFIMVAVLALTLAFAVSAESVHNENTVDYSAKVTLNNGTEVNLFDDEGNALIWYLDASGALQSIRADDRQVRWYTEGWGEVTGVSITFDNGTSVGSGNFVVVNMLDDEVVKNHGPGTSYYGGAITGFKLLFNGCKKLEYVYLRLDTTGIYRQSFNDCQKLKYINLEDLTKLTRIGDGGQFANCKELFKGQVLDLSKTKLTSIDEGNIGSAFWNVPLAGIRLPSTITNLGNTVLEQSSIESIVFPMSVKLINQKLFKNCANLTTVYLSNSLSGINQSENLTIRADAFYNCNALEKIFYVGTLDELNGLLEHTSTTGNDAFWAVVGENNANVISYADYKKLADKSGKYVVYDYSYCEAYNDGVHTPVTATNNCVGVCDTCGDTVVNHTEKENLSVTYEYENYGKTGTKTTSCQNEGCTYSVKEEIPALITCYGYSTPENSDGRIVIGFVVNQDAIDAYKENTGKTVEFGAFAIAQKNLTENGILNSSGEANKGAIKAEVQDNISSYELIITGFKTEEQKNALLALGAYVITTKNAEVKVSYIQHGTPLDNAEYCFTSYNQLN